MMFKKATQDGSYARIALIGPAGSGKTYSALAMAKHLGQRVALVDTERGSASKYANEFDFFAVDPPDHSPRTYIEALKAAEEQGFDVIVLDSLSHAWMGRGGALEQVENNRKRGNDNSFTAWRDVTPQHNALVDAMLSVKAHLVVTLRAKTEYAVEKDEKGRTSIRKVGLAPIQRDGLEFEFDVVGDLNLDHDYIISKTRCSVLDGRIYSKPGYDLAKTILDWLGGPREVPEEQVRLFAAIDAAHDADQLAALVPAIQAADPAVRDRIRPYYQRRSEEFQRS